MKITFKVRLKAGIKYDKEAKVYVTYAPVLRLYSQGETMIQAKSALEDAIQSFLIVAYRNGVLEKYLKNVGFTADASPQGKLPECAEYISIKEETILEQKKFGNIFEIPAFLPLTMATV